MQVSSLVFTITLGTVTSTILQIRKLSSKKFLSLGHTYRGGIAGISPQVCEPKCSGAFPLPFILKKEPCLGVHEPLEFVLALPNRWMGSLTVGVGAASMVAMEPDFAFNHDLSYSLYWPSESACLTNHGAHLLLKSWKATMSYPSTEVAVSQSTSF